ncbi:MAG: hypothetical protein K6F04_02085 [bacterium]|nr:hypothetical protein [bacterium]
MIEKIKKVISDKKELKKENIVKEYMHWEQQAVGLVVMKADEYVKSKKAKTFRDACKMIVKEMEENNSKHSDGFLSEQEKDMINFMRDGRD